MRESFGYGYGEIAEIVEKSQANCRQIYSRAKRALPKEKYYFEESLQIQQQTVAALWVRLWAKTMRRLQQLFRVRYWTRDGQIVATYAMRNPDKLRHIEEFKEEGLTYVC